MKCALADNLNRIPSQMLKYKGLQLILSNGDYWKNYADNIFMGILGKLGGTPFVLADNPFHIDLIVGLDVGMEQKGKHTPVAASVFSGIGGFHGVLAPKNSIIGEIIDFDEMKKMMDRLLTVYQDIPTNTSRSLPKRLLLLRDGFAREATEKLDVYFKKLDISYRFIEIRKSGGVAERFADSQTTNFNPSPGTVILNETEQYAVLVSSTPKAGGAPRPVKICLGEGNLEISLLDATQQVYWLTKLNSASFDNTRLPEPQRIADKISKNPDFLPLGEVVFHKYWL